MSLRPIKTTIVTVDDEREAMRCSKGRVILIDDDHGFLDSLDQLLHMEGYATESYQSAMEFLGTLKSQEPVFDGPSCLVCDVKMPDLDGLSLQQLLVEQLDMPFILMSGLSGPREASLAFRKGALDFLVKPFLVEEFLSVVDRAIEQSRKVRLGQKQQQALSERVGTLTERERFVVQQVVHGQTNIDIAQRMNVALRTVKLYRQRAMEKLGAENLADLVRLADAAKL
jgi:FixJ family two-component response regulator